MLVCLLTICCADVMVAMEMPMVIMKTATYLEGGYLPDKVHPNITTKMLKINHIYLLFLQHDNTQCHICHKGALSSELTLKLSC